MAFTIKADICISVLSSYFEFGCIPSLLKVYFVKVLAYSNSIIILCKYNKTIVIEEIKAEYRLNRESELDKMTELGRTDAKQVKENNQTKTKTRKKY